MALQGEVSGTHSQQDGAAKGVDAAICEANCQNVQNSGLVQVSQLNEIIHSATIARIEAVIVGIRELDVGQVILAIAFQCGRYCDDFRCRTLIKDFY